MKNLFVRLKKAPSKTPQQATQRSGRFCPGRATPGAPSDQRSGRKESREGAAKQGIATTYKKGPAQMSNKVDEKARNLIADYVPCCVSRQYEG